VRISAIFLFWVVMAFLAAACWGAVFILNKKVLDYVSPVAVNFFVVSVSAASLAAIALPMSLLHLWPLGLGLTWPAAGYIALSAPVLWLVAFNAYYVALRSGRVGVVGPLCCTDPLFTALFATVLLGAALGGLTIAGLLVAVLGVALISRWMGAEPQPPRAGSKASQAPSRPRRLEGTVTPAPARAGTVVTLSLLTAASWGLAPVLIQLAERSTGGATASMMVLGEALGTVLLTPFIIAQRGALFVGEAARGRRHVWALLIGAGLLNAVFSVLYYVLIAEIGPVLTMLITASAPIFAVAGGVLFLHERLDRRLALGAAVTLTGVSLAILQQVH